MPTVRDVGCLLEPMASLNSRRLDIFPLGVAGSRVNAVPRGRRQFRIGMLQLDHLTDRRFGQIRETTDHSQALLYFLFIMFGSIHVVDSWTDVHLSQLDEQANHQQDIDNENEVPDDEQNGVFADDRHVSI